MNNSFWQNSFMDWFEKKLLAFTNWFWEKRKQTQPKPFVRIPPTLDEQEPSPKKPAVKRSTTRKTTKKTSPKSEGDWSVK
jgi:hypothetical protein